jgi:hypothetical protein
VKHNPAEIIQGAIAAGLDIDAPVMTIEEREKFGTYVLVLYNGKRVEWSPAQDVVVEGFASPPAKPSTRRPRRRTS